MYGYKESYELYMNKFQNFLFINLIPFIIYSQSCIYNFIFI